MANKNLFGSRAVANVPAVDTVNAAGGAAYSTGDKHILAQLAATSCFNSTYYAGGKDHLDLAKKTLDNLKNDQEFVAKVAVYSRDRSYMKDMPAYILAWLACQPNGETNDRAIFRKAFVKAIDNGKMLRNFIQIGRSGAAGHALNLTNRGIRNAINDWFTKKSPEAIFRASVGNDPTIQDILRMARPTPNTPEKAALYAYLLTDMNKAYDPAGDGNSFDPEARVFNQYRTVNGVRVLTNSAKWDDLPQVVKDYEEFKKTKTGTPPNVEFRLLDSLGMDSAQWTEVFRNGGWQFTRMNLKTAIRQGVHKHDPSMIQLIADRLKSREEIQRARAFPYQLMNAYWAVNPPKQKNSWYGNVATIDAELADMPSEWKEALQDALEISTENVPDFPTLGHIAIDVSGSMSSAITGDRGSATTNVRCIDVAALVTATMIRKNKKVKVHPFDGKVHQFSPNPRDSIVTIASTLAEYGGGATHCALVLKQLNDTNASGDVMYISDNESWVTGSYRGNGTAMMEEWKKYKKRNPTAKLVLNDLQPSDNSQVTLEKDILQVGGWSDTVFDVLSGYLTHGMGTDHWVKEIEAIEL